MSWVTLCLGHHWSHILLPYYLPKNNMRILTHSSELWRVPSGALLSQPMPIGLLTQHILEWVQKLLVYPPWPADPKIHLQPLKPESFITGLLFMSFCYNIHFIPCLAYSSQNPFCFFLWILCYFSQIKQNYQELSMTPSPQGELFCIILRNWVISLPPFIDKSYDIFFPTTGNEITYYNSLWIMAAHHPGNSFKKSGERLAVPLT